MRLPHSILAIFMLASWYIPAGVSYSKAGMTSELVFSSKLSACDSLDIPDAPARAFRDSNERVHLTSSHFITRQNVGVDFQHLTHLCLKSFSGDFSDDPDAFSDRSWLTGFYTQDGINVLALVHNEFQGNLRPTLCPSTLYMHCWENSVAMAFSKDDGFTFHRIAGAIAALPYPYEGDVGHPIGYFQPSNFFHKGDRIYFSVLSQQFRNQSAGHCLAESDNPWNFASWRFIEKGKFDANLQIHEPRKTGKVWTACDPVGLGKIFELASILYIPLLEKFAIISSIESTASSPGVAPALYVTYSSDFQCFGNPILISRLRDLPFCVEQGSICGYFSVLDHHSLSRYFDTIDDIYSTYLYYVSLDHDHPNDHRNLYRTPIIIPSPGSSLGNCP